MMISHPTQRVSEQASRFLHAVPIPRVVMGYVVAARGGAIGALDEEPQVRFEHGREEYDQRRSRNREYLLSIGPFFLQDQESEFNVARGNAGVSDNRLGEHQPVLLDIGPAFLLPDDTDAPHAIPEVIRLAAQVWERGKKHWRRFGTV